jgi:hypothetical protein
MLQSQQGRQYKLVQGGVSLRESEARMLGAAL